MRRAIVVAVIALTPALAASCSLFVSLDGLQEPDAAASLDGAADTSTPIDAGLEDSLASGDGAADGSVSILSCNADGLVAYWPMDEGTGTQVKDCHQGINGVFGGDGGVSWGTRGGGSNIEFSSSGYVTFGSDARLELPGPFTVTGWFRSDAPSIFYASLYWNFDSSSLVGFEITLAPGGQLYAQVGLGTAAVQADFASPPTGVWEHLAAVFKPGAELRIYVNGVNVGATTRTETDAAIPEASVPPDNHETRLGPNYPSSSWRGGVDDVRLFSRALTDEEIAALAAP
jgi:hypothetical protein